MKFIFYKLFILFACFGNYVHPSILNDAKEECQFTLRGSAPILLSYIEKNQVNEIIVPAFIAGQTMLTKKTESLLDFLSQSIGMLMPELLIKPATLNSWSKFLKSSNVAKIVGSRLIKNIDDFKSAIAKGENVFYVGKHSDIMPRPTGVQSHHGVNTVWMEVQYSNYSMNNAPSVYMLNNPNHNATRGVFNTWRADIRAKQGGNIVDYSKVSEEEIIDLSKRQFDAADVPQDVRDEYYKLWKEYIKTLNHIK